MRPEEGLIVEDLRVAFGDVVAVRGISFAVGRERVGLVGESGSGKSMTGRAILRLAPPGARVSAAKMSFKGTDLLALDERGMRDIRGQKITMILQDPRFSLHPVMTMGAQIAEAYRLHHRASRREAREHAMSMLEAVRIQDPRRVYDLYRHQVSGGMGQRIMIAMMLVQEPELVIADEPTSALDVVVRSQVLAILDDMVRARGLGLIFISHDLDLVRSFCDRILVMYRGRIVEELMADALDDARHPYTRGLLAAIPRASDRGKKLAVLERDPAWSA